MPVRASARQEVLTVAYGRFFRDHPTIVIMACAFVPILAIGVIGVLARLFFADVQQSVVPVNLSVVPVDLSNVSILKKLFEPLLRLLRPSDAGDSWDPMLQALAVSRGPDRNELYETLVFGRHVRFQYPPTSLLYVDILSAMGLASVRVLNAINTLVYILNAVAAGVLAWLLFRAPGRVIKGSDRCLHPGGMAAIALTAALVFYPIIRAQVLGQIQLWIDLLFTCALVAWMLERRLLAGILIGLGCTIKPQFALLFLWGVLWREWAFSGGILAALVPVTVVSMFRYGSHAHFAYLDVLKLISQHGESFFRNNSVNGILNGYFSSTNTLNWDVQTFFAPYHPVVYLGTMAASCLALAAIALPPWLWRKRRPDIADLGAAAICTIIGSPVAWDQHYGILLPIYFVALKCLVDEPVGPRRSVRLAGLGLSWVLVASFVIPFVRLLVGTPFSFLHVHLFFGAVLLVALLFGRASSGAPSYRDRPARSTAAPAMLAVTRCTCDYHQSITNHSIATNPRNRH
jgi:hypothetical protein